MKAPLLVAILAQEIPVKKKYEAYFLIDDQIKTFETSYARVKTPDQAIKNAFGTSPNIERV